MFTYFFHRPWQRRGERFARSCLSFIAMMHALQEGRGVQRVNRSIRNRMLPEITKSLFFQKEIGVWAPRFLLLPQNVQGRHESRLRECCGVCFDLLACCLFGILGRLVDTIYYYYFLILLLSAWLFIWHIRKTCWYNIFTPLAIYWLLDRVVVGFVSICLLFIWHIRKTLLLSYTITFSLIFYLTY